MRADEIAALHQVYGVHIHNEIAARDAQGVSLSERQTQSARERLPLPGFHDQMEAVDPLDAGDRRCRRTEHAHPIEVCGLEPAAKAGSPSRGFF